jgi:hypothetical protein
MKTATTEITSIRPRHCTGRERSTPLGCIVSVDSAATNKATEWFNKHEVWGIDWKCKTWSRLQGAGTKLTIASLREIFGPDADIKFSMYAGCSMCPCSPGYRVKNLTGDLVKKYGNQYLWVKVTEDTTAFEASFPKYDEKLKAEKETHKDDRDTALEKSN